MNTKVFQSSNLTSGVYDAASGMVTLTFNSGHVYTGKVPEPAWNGLCQAVSPGQYFHKEIQPHYTFTRLEGDPDASR